MKPLFKIIPMGELCSIKSGKSDTQDAVEDGAYAFFDRSRTIKRSSRYLYDCEALIIPGEGTEFLPRHFRGKFDLHQRAYAIFNFTDRVDVRFLYYFLHHKSDYFPQVAVGATVKSLRLRHFEQLPVSLTTIPEQHRIVAILDEAFEKIAIAKINAEKNLKNARAVFESHLNAVFSQRGDGWVEKMLGEFSDIKYGYTQSACSEVVGPKFLRITDIKNDRVNWASVPYCPIETGDYPKYKISHGDIVFARTGATTGKSYLVINPPDAVFASYLIRVKLNAKNCLPEFLYLFFQTHVYWDGIRSGVSGSAQGGFNATKLGELVVPFPVSLEQQNSIVANCSIFREETQRLESLYQQKLVALDQLKQSLLHQAFSGAL